MGTLKENVYKQGTENLAINVGDTFFGKEAYKFNSLRWRHRYTVLKVVQSERFGKPAVLLTVKVEAVYADGSGHVIDSSVDRWLSQCE